MNKILIITDTTYKQINGVVTTLYQTAKNLTETGKYTIKFINPSDFNTFSLPFYKEIDISLNSWTIGKLIESYSPDYIHIATEGPVGLAGKLYCDKVGHKYTTSYHSKFPEFINNMFKVPTSVTYPYFKWFHSKSEKVLVPTKLVKEELSNLGFVNLVVWGRGVDRRLFNSTIRTRSKNSHLKIVLCVSRISKEKGLDDFCQLPVPDGYLKVLVGDGPYLGELINKYRAEAVAFAGKKVGRELAQIYANADVFVFPSKTDTFGLTQLESIACGTPVLAYKGTVSEEIIKNGKSGYLIDELNIDEVYKALELSRKYVEDESYNWTWKKCTKIFAENLVKTK